jgi:monoamine oxidase
MSRNKSGKNLRFTRRDALKLLGVGGSGTLAAGSLLTSQQANIAQRSDVVIVGAGFAGMVAARNLNRAGKKVVVLEARDRVGGRVKAGQIAGQSVDLGGMWVGPTQTRLLELIKEYGLHTTPQFEDGKDVSELNGKRTLAEGEDAGLDAVGQAEYDCVIHELNRLTATVPLDEPWAMPRAEEFDDMTVADWFESQTKNESLLGFLRLTTRLNFAADPSHISFLYFLFYQRSGDDFETLNTFKNGAQAFLVRETMHHLATRVAKELGKSIVTEAPVSKIVQDASGVTVVSDKGEWRADYAIVAVPLPLSTRITYNPPLPSQRDILAQQMPMGSVIKYWVAYEKPFWRERGLNGLAWSDVPPTDGFCDASPPEGSPGLLVGFFESREARNWTGRPQEERKKLIVDRIASLLGPEGANPIDYQDQDWPSEIWSRGCYGGFMGPGVMTTVGKSIRVPHGRIHWAGSETSARWMGYIDGAIRSGDRTASEILAHYQKTRTAMTAPQTSAP